MIHRTPRTTLLRILLVVTLAVLAVAFLLPIAWMLSSSLTPNSLVFRYPPRWIPTPPTLENYVEVLTTTRTARIGPALLNSFLVASITVVFTLLVSALAAYPLARMKFPGRKGLFLLILAGLMVPGEVTFVSLFLLFQSLGWLNSYQALILPSLASPFGVFLLRQFFLSIPRDIEDAARIDGCGRLRILFQIILPLARPALATLTIFTFLTSWNNFLWPLIAITEPSMMTVPVILAYYSSAFKISLQWGTLMAVAFVSSILPVGVFLIFQREFVRGITLSGLKY
jgi:multiple sugar transport system permease protein